MAALAGTIIGWVGCGLLVWGWGEGSTVGKCVAVAYIATMLAICGLGVAGVIS